MKKIYLLILFSTILTAFLFIFETVDAKGLSEEENLVINDKEVTYYKSNEVVKIPTTYQNKLFEMRGMWVATVWNGDFKTVGSVNAYKSQFIKVLDNLEKNNFNTILFQIRPSNDAFYISDLNPFSEWMTGVQGKTIKNTDGTVFDPLEWMIEETHKRNMQFIGWMNAYRVSARTLYSDSSNNYAASEVKEKVDSTIKSLDDLNFAKKYPKYVLLGDNDPKLILNPGEPAVRKHITSSIEEIVRKYDIDGVHFDDYFYLDSSNPSKAEVVVADKDQYKNADTAFNDNYNDFNTYIAYSLPNETLGDFRRRSVNLMIQDVSNVIKKVNNELGKDVQFGSKPAAVWTAAGKSVVGRIKGANVLTYSYSSYYDIFADSLYWAEQGWVDWIAPQIYFNYTNQEVPYADIVKWWAEAIEQANVKLKELGKKEVRLYIAHGAYRMSSSEPLEKQITDDTELVKQLLYNQKYDVIKGSAFYDYSTYFATSNIATESRKNVLKLFSIKTLPYQNENCDLFIDDFKEEESTDNNKIITIYCDNSNVLGYAIYLNNSILNLQYLKDGFVQFTIDKDMDYQIYSIDNEYNVSLDAINISPNIITKCIDIYVGDEYVFSDNGSYESIINTNNDALKISDGKIIGLSKGKSVVTTVKDDVTTNYYVNVYNNQDFQIVVENNDGYSIEVMTEKTYRENKDLIIKVTIEDFYTYQNAILKVNDEIIDISNYEKNFTLNLGKIEKDYHLGISGVKKNRYLVIIKNGDEVSSVYVEHGDDVIFPEPIESYGNKFIGWSHNGKNITEQIVINSQYSSELIKVYFETNGGNDIGYQELFYLDKLVEVTPVRNGYKFIGWYVDEELTKPYDNDLVKEDMTLYASWEKESGCNNGIACFFNIFSIILPLGLIKKFKKY